MEIDGDNLMGYMNEACMWSSKACVPYGGVSCFNENFQPTNPSYRRCLNFKALGIYLGQHLQAIKDRFPHHEPADAPKEQVTPWWCALRNSFLKRCKKFQESYGDDVVFGIEPVVPLYKNNCLATTGSIPNTTSSPVGRSTLPATIKAVREGQDERRDLFESEYIQKQYQGLV